MASYRLYLASDLPQRFASSLELDAKNDQAAIALANGFRGARTAELWHRDRLVKEWKA